MPGKGNAIAQHEFRHEHCLPVHQGLLFNSVEGSRVSTLAVLFEHIRFPFPVLNVLLPTIGYHYGGPSGHLSRLLRGIQTLRP